MRQKIRHHKTGEILYEGEFSSLAACVEDAIQSHAILDGADLSRANLINACLDGGSFRNARFHGANLMGTNLSETILDHADFTNTELQNTCICASSLSCVIFHGASFGATNIADSTLVNCAFDTLSAFTLNFADVRELRNCSFNNASNNLSFFYVAAGAYYRTVLSRRPARRLHARRVCYIPAGLIRSQSCGEEFLCRCTVR